MSRVINPAGAVASFAKILVPVEDMAELGGGQNLHKQIKERARTEGFEQGYEAGYAAGQTQGHADAFAEAMRRHDATLAQFAAELLAVDESIPAALQSWLDATSEQVMLVAVAIATEIVGQQLAANPTTVLSMVSNTLKEVTTAQEARIRINPVDAPAVSENLDALIAATPSLRSLTIIRDPNIAAGCTVETDGGTIDARADRMVERALEALRRAA